MSKEPKGKTDWKVLKKLAEISPKSYAARIRKRNQVVLTALNKLKPGDTVNEKWKLGCPHCKNMFKCRECLWAKAGGIGTEQEAKLCCLRVSFGGISNYSERLVGLGDKIIQLRGFNITQELIRNTRVFLQAHIDWTNKYEWGSKYKRGKR